MRTVTTYDDEHVDHETDLLEVIHDNAVEKTVWMRCLDCQTEFRALNVMVED